MAVNSISNLNSLVPVKSIGEDNNNVGVGGFSDVLKEMISTLNQYQSESSEQTRELAAGNTDNLQKIMIAGEKADIALQFTMQIRNKILDAYNEIMRIQV